MFNPAHTRQAVPFISLIDGAPLPVVKEMRLLGLVLDCGLTWWPMITDIANRCKPKIWSLIKLREAGAAIPQLLTLYTARVRSTCEYGCQVYGGIINASQSNVLEDIQTRCCQIILGERSSSYAANLEILELDR